MRLSRIKQKDSSITMRMHDLIKKDYVIYWKKVAVNDEGEPEFAEPVIIKCRWDQVSTDAQTEDVLTLEVPSNAVYPDRILVIGSYLMLGDSAVLENLTPLQRQDPRFIREARSVKSQSWVFEFGWEQFNVQPDFQSEHITIECRV